MRRLALLLLAACVLLAPAGCKRKRNRAPVAPVEETGLMATMLNVGDPHAATQLVKGFYPVENNQWRWTARSFTVSLHPPKQANQKGARLVLKFAIPDPVMAQLRPIKLAAKVNGLDLPTEEYTTPGDQTYTREVPASALSGDTITVDFLLDKFLPPSAADQRELGVIVSAVGFEAK